MTTTVTERGSNTLIDFDEADLRRASPLLMQVCEFGEWQAAQERRSTRLERAVTAVLDLAQRDNEAQYFAETLPDKLHVDPRVFVRQLLQRVAV